MTLPRAAQDDRDGHLTTKRQATTRHDHFGRIAKKVTNRVKKQQKTCFFILRKELILRQCLPINH